LPKTLPRDFGRKCPSYIEAPQPNKPFASKFTNKNQDEENDYMEKPLHSTEITYPEIGKGTTLRYEPILAKLKKGFVSRGRMRVRAPSEVPRRPPRIETPQISRVTYLPKYSWTMEDRKIFSIDEMQIKGYCEGCSNYGALSYENGLYLCPTCRYLLAKT